MNANRRRTLRGAVALSLLTASGLRQTAGLAASGTPVAAPPAGTCGAVLSHALRPLAGSEAAPLCDRFAGKVLLFVNTASKCAFTPQFKGLDELHARYADRGFSVLGFPSDDFRQELSSEAEVAEFCELNYGVDFPMFQKVAVRGDDAHPLYRDLAAHGLGEPTWNFHKYLVDRTGRVVSHYGSTTAPVGRQLLDDIDAVL